MKIPLLPNLPKVYKRWQSDDGPLMAAAVAYYAALSFFPLLLVVISGLGLVMQYTEWGQDAQEQSLSAIAEYASPAVRDNVATLLDRVQRSAVISGPLGIGMLIFTAAALFVHFERAFDRIWNVQDTGDKGILASIKNLVFQRLRAFLMLLGIGILVLVIFTAGMVLSSIKAWTTDYLPVAEWLWWIIEIGVSFTLNTCVFMLLYKLLPKVPIRWPEAFRGGLLAAGVWEIARLILAAFVSGDKYNAYGMVGSFIAIMLWIYVATTIVFLGAEYIQVICAHRESAQRSPSPSSHRMQLRGSGLSK